MKYTHVALLILSLAALCGCQPVPGDPVEIKIQETTAMEETRFKVIRAAEFRDDTSYHGTRRIYVIIDHQTEKEFIGITGVGVAEIGQHRSGKQTFRDER